MAKNKNEQIIYDYYVRRMEIASQLVRLSGSDVRSAAYRTYCGHLAFLRRIMRELDGQK